MYRMKSISIKSKKDCYITLQVQSNLDEPTKWGLYNPTFRSISFDKPNLFYQLTFTVRNEI